MSKNLEGIDDAVFVFDFRGRIQRERAEILLRLRPVRPDHERDLRLGGRVDGREEEVAELCVDLRRSVDAELIELKISGIWDRLQCFAVEGSSLTCLKKGKKFVDEIYTDLVRVWLWEETHVLKVVGSNPCAVYWM